METKIKLSEIENKFLIVVKGEEHKVVYDVDDSRIFSVHVTGCGRGSRNAVLSRKTFFSNTKKTGKAIEYLESSFRGVEFCSVLFAELKNISKTGYENLIEDIEDYNRDIDFDREYQKEENAAFQAEYEKTKEKAIKLINEKFIFEIEETDDSGGYTTIKVR